MNLKDEIQTVIKRLEDIKNLQVPDIDSIREQVDDIEYNLLPQLDKMHDEFLDEVYGNGEPDGITIKKMDEIGDAFVQADALVHDIRVKFGLESTEEEYVQDDNELLRKLIFGEGDSNDDFDEESDEYDIVLREVSKSALKNIGLVHDDENAISLMGDILIGIGSGEDDETVAGKTFAHMVMTGVVMSMENIKEMCVEAREKCKIQLFGLQIAYGSLDEYHCSAEEALMQIQMFL